MKRKYKYFIFKSVIAYLLISSLITWVYASEITSCRCLHSSCSHKKGNLNKLAGFSVQFKVISKNSKNNNCCSHKTNNPKQSKDCTGTCECSVSNAISTPKDVLISQSRFSISKDFSHISFLSLLYTPANTTNRQDLSPPLKPLSNKLFLSFSTLRV